MKTLRFFLVTLAFMILFIYVLREWKTEETADVFSQQLAYFDVSSSQVFLSAQADGQFTSRLKLAIKVPSPEAFKKPLYLATSDLRVNKVICAVPAYCSFQNADGLTRININQNDKDPTSTALEIGFAYPELKSKRFAFKKNIEFPKGDLVAPYIPGKYYETEITLQIPKSYLPISNSNLKSENTRYTRNIFIYAHSAPLPTFSLAVAKFSRKEFRRQLSPVTIYYRDLDDYQVGKINLLATHIQEYFTQKSKTNFLFDLTLFEAAGETLGDFGDTAVALQGMKSHELSPLGVFSLVCDLTQKRFSEVVSDVEADKMLIRESLSILAALHYLQENNPTSDLENIIHYYQKSYFHSLDKNQIRDEPLSRTHSRILIRSKGAAFFYMLLQQFNHPFLWDRYFSLIAQKKEISREELIELFEPSAAKEISTLWNEWLDRPGAPQIWSMISTHQKYSRDHTLTGTLNQKGQTYSLNMPVEVVTAKSRSEKNIPIFGPSTEFVIPLDGPLIEFSVDPRRVVLNRRSELFQLTPSENWVAGLEAKLKKINVTDSRKEIENLFIRKRGQKSFAKFLSYLNEVYTVDSLAVLHRESRGAIRGLRAIVTCSPKTSASPLFLNLDLIFLEGKWWILNWWF